MDNKLVGVLWAVSALMPALILAMVLSSCSDKEVCTKHTDAQSCLQNKCNWDTALNVCTAPQ